MTAYLEGIGGEFVGRRIPLGFHQLTIGCNPNSQLRLQQTNISRKHAVIYFTNGVYVINDLSSRSGTFINSRNVKSAQLLNGDMITFGASSFRFVQPDQTSHVPNRNYSEPVRITEIVGIVFLIVTVIVAGVWGISSMINKSSNLQVNLEEEQILPSVVPDLSDLEIGPTMVLEKDNMTLVYVPEGEFLRGSVESDPAADYDEFPQRSIYLDAFWIDQTEVTNAMFADFLNEEENQKEGRVNWLDSASEYARVSVVEGTWQADGRYADHPVIEVSWYGANAYCVWAGKRLPTEAEWEKAARGDDGRTYPFGESISCNQSNYCASENYPETSTSSVGNYGSGGASPYGVYDMAGNVWEWVGDWYDDDYYERSPIDNPTGPDSGSDRVMRGGSWANNARLSRSAVRHNGPPDYTWNYIGFRCALSP
jgi:formylglycine-generating enzyme